jgi:heterodisulfide reductase subunit C
MSAELISRIVFILISIGAIALFTINVRKVRRNILLGRDVDRSDKKGERWKIMALVALGQKKMFQRPLPALLHLFVYVGFVLINIEVIEMLIDGAFGTHRFLSFLNFEGFRLYDFLVSFFEILAALVTLGCIVFLTRRNVVRVKRLVMKELDGWPRTDANLILVTEIVLMSALFLMNAADQAFDFKISQGNAAPFLPVSKFLVPALTGSDLGTLLIIERICWWLHIIGIYGFLNYLIISKHFHIILSFPNVFYSNLNPKGKFTNLNSVTVEVKAMLDPSFVPPPVNPEVQNRFGAKDVFDLTWKQLLDSYTCTECGRCTSACPANQTGKLLSPRKIMMDTRDRLQEVGKNIDNNKGKFVDDGKALFGNYISAEELWACTSCNACVQECPVNIDPLSIIIDIRRFLVMEQSAAPQGLNLMFTNIENNGAPWQFSPADRLNWANEN